MNQNKKNRLTGETNEAYLQLEWRNYHDTQIYNKNQQELYYAINKYWLRKTIKGKNKKNNKIQKKVKLHELKKNIKNTLWKIR